MEVAHDQRIGLLMLAALAHPAMAQTCACGPDFCLGDARYPKILAQKKQDLSRQDYPARLTNLLDRGVRCVASVERAPDGFTILVVKPNGDNGTVPWDEDNERIAR